MSDKKYFVLEGENKFREPTKEEYLVMISFQEKVKEFEKLKYMIDKCTHPVLYDEEGYTYHDRVCACCGRIVDTI